MRFSVTPAHIDESQKSGESPREYVRRMARETAAAGGRPGKVVLAVETAVRFAPLSEGQVRWLAASGDGDDKAGAYAVQGLAGAFVERIEGSFTNVVGLPLLETLRLLAEVSVELPWT